MERQRWGPLSLSKARPCGHPRASPRTLINPVFAELFPGFLPTQSAPCGIGLILRLPFSHTLWCTRVSPRFKVSPQMTDEIWAPTTRAEALKVVSAILSSNKTVHKLFTACLMRGQWKLHSQWDTYGPYELRGNTHNVLEPLPEPQPGVSPNQSAAERFCTSYIRSWWKGSKIHEAVAKLQSCRNAKQGSKDLSWTDF